MYAYKADTYVIRSLVTGDGVLCYGALEIVGLLLLLLLLPANALVCRIQQEGWLSSTERASAG